MAPSPRRRYSHMPLGLFELLPISIADSKPSALLLLMWLYLSPLRRSVPGLIHAGPIALADAIGWSVPATKRYLAELEKAGIVAVEGRIVWIRRAIADDAPKNGNVLTAWAAQLEELPPCSVVASIVDAVESAILELDQAAALATKWRGLTHTLGNKCRNSSKNSSPNSFGVGSRNSRGTPTPIPNSDSVTASDSASAAGTTTAADSTSRGDRSYRGGSSQASAGPYRRT